MVAIACRWPGGTNLVLKKNDLKHVVVHVNGPPGSPQETPVGGGNPLKSRHAALGMHKRILDTLDRMKGSKEHPIERMNYVVTEVNDQFWSAWYEQNEKYDLVQHKIVFAMPAAEAPLMIEMLPPKTKATVNGN